MGDNVLMSNEIEFYISNLENSKIQDIGTKPWLEAHQRLQKLHQQAILEAKELKEESVKEMFVSYNKIGKLVYDAICLNIWRNKVLPRLLKIESEPENTFLLYSAMYHEGICVALLEIVLFHGDSCEILDDYSVDLLDYVHEQITGLLSLTLELPGMGDGDKIDIDALYKSELPRLRNNTAFDIGIRCVSVLFHLISNIDRFSFSTTNRLYTTLDIPLLLVKLIEVRPWEKTNSKNELFRFIDGKWQLIKGDLKVKVAATEAHLWLCLRQLFLNPKCQNIYEFNDFRKSQIIRLQKFLNDTLLDQISPLIDLKYWLCQLSVSNPPSVAKSNILLEVVPEIKKSILESGYKKWKHIANKQAKFFFNSNREELKELAQGLSDAYNVDFIERMEKIETEETPNCAAECGYKGYKKCSQCKSVFYCGRECQVKDWPKHKLQCLAVDKTIN